jgi:two-component system sensor histidine kinase CpxA
MKITVRSIFPKVVLWFVATAALSLVGLLATSMLVRPRFSGRDTIMPRMSAFILDDARRAYEEGGSRQLDLYLKRLNTSSGIDHFLTDGSGTDLVTGEDRSAVRGRGPGPRGHPLLWLLPRSGPFIRVRASADGRYRLVIVSPVPPQFATWDYLEYFLWLPLLIAVLCYLLAVHLASPLRNLQRVVERFGRGELGSRFHVSRQDEIGELAQAFNHMADQITTLLSAERRLLQDVSHELRSPLARLGFAVELANSSSNPEMALARIRKEAGRLNNLVDEMLQLTRAEGDPHARNLESVDLGDLIDDLVADCALEADARGCRLALRINQRPIVTADRELIRRACDNVLRNAIGHAPAESAIVIELSAEDGRATIRVRDLGPGVPPEALSEIFKPFYRVEEDRDRSSGGGGLGLAIASRAVSLHHGRMIARNANPGLILDIELPVRSPE